MGNSKSSQTHGQIITVNHPNFGEVELIDHEGQKYMKIKMLVDSEKTIKKWEEEQKILKGIDTEPLLLSTDHQFEKQGMCGTTGVLHVKSIISRFSTKITLSYSRMKSKTGKKPSRASNRTKSGICCTF